MNNKPITPRLHGEIDYVLSAVQLLGPVALGLTDSARKAYMATGSAMLGVNALTETPVGIKRVLTVKDHQRADLTMIGVMAVMTLAKFIRKDKKALAFHLTLLAGEAVHYALTDYSAGEGS